ncbi:MAG TPA: class II aldolase/adducin family protein [Candidatus Marinimicrobia bacterium]|nr:class II aldolase/adducin family protein [Candidatus Neomarinimicrobiota bacterium]
MTGENNGSARHYSELRNEDIVIVNSELDSIGKSGVPSSESLLHLSIYTDRPDVNAVVHTHATFSSVASLSSKGIPPILDEMVIYIGGSIDVSKYAFPGTEELAQRVCEALSDKNAVLISNHGAVGVGNNLREAINVSILTERIAKIYAFSRLDNQIKPLPSSAVEKERAIFEMKRKFL